MKSVGQITDFDHLKQAAVLLEKENTHLHDRLEKLVSEIAELKGEPQQELVELEINKLREQLAALRSRMFGDSSEKRPDTLKSATPPNQPQRGHGPRPQSKLPLEDKTHELAAEEQVCPACQGQLVEMKGQCEESEEVTVVERSFKLVRHLRKKYRCRCNGAIVTAPGPLKHIPGGRYSLEFAVEVAANKYLEHLPLERQRKAMLRQGLEVRTQTLWDQIDALALRLEPFYIALRREVLSAPVIHADETWWRLMEQRRKKRWWVWSIVSPTAVYHEIFPDRSTKAAKQVLDGYSGVVVVDDYSAYRSAARAGPERWLLCNCWAHVRRQFVEAQPFNKAACTEVLDLIGELYQIEREISAEAQENGATPEQLLRLRQRAREARSRPALDKLKEWAYSQRALPQSALRKAVEYMLRLWPGLTRFVYDPRVPLDNNVVERALRSVVLGRKNHYGSHSRRGTEVAALYYSLFETAKLRDVEPKAFLLEVATRAIASHRARLLPESKSA